MRFGMSVNFKTINLNLITTPRAMEEKVAKNPELMKEYKKQYTAARDIIQKRLKRMQKFKVKPGDFNPRHSGFYKGWMRKGGVEKLSDIKSEAQFFSILYTMKLQLESPAESTISGLTESAKERVRGLHAAGYGIVPGTENDKTPQYFITEKNLADFGDFMERYRALHQHSIGSPEVVQLYMEVRGVGMTNAEFFKEFKDYFASKEKGLKMLTEFEAQAGKRQTSAEARKLLKERLPK